MRISENTRYLEEMTSDSMRNITGCILASVVTRVEKELSFTDTTGRFDRRSNFVSRLSCILISFCLYMFDFLTYTYTQTTIDI